MVEGDGDGPDWKRYGVETQQPVPKPVFSQNDATEEYTETDSDENELFREEQVSEGHVINRFLAGGPGHQIKCQL